MLPYFAMKLDIAICYNESNISLLLCPERISGSIQFHQKLGARQGKVNDEPRRRKRPHDLASCIASSSVWKQGTPGRRKRPHHPSSTTPVPTRDRWHPIIGGTGKYFCFEFGKGSAIMRLCQNRWMIISTPMPQNFKLSAEH